MTTIVYISIGNSDDKLTQKEWSNYWGEVSILLKPSDTIGVHGVWLSPSASPFQNACFCIEINDSFKAKIRGNLRYVARKFGQDSIAWAEVKETEFLD